MSTRLSAAKCCDQQQEPPQSHKSINNIVFLHPATSDDDGIPSYLSGTYHYWHWYIELCVELRFICSSPDKHLKCPYKQAAGLVCRKLAITIATAYLREGFRYLQRIRL